MNALQIIKELELVLNIDLPNQFEVDDLEDYHFGQRGYSLDNEGNINGISITNCNFENVELLVEFVKHVKSLTSLNLRNNNIRNIDSLNQLVNISCLNLSLNKIEDILSLAKLINLELLFLEQNDVKNISPLKGLKKLEILDLDNNKISSLKPLQSLSNLSILYLQGNRIYDIESLKNLNNIESLLLSSNNIIDIFPLKNLTQLRSLHLQDNNINNISVLVEMPNLVDVLLNANPIIDPPPEIVARGVDAIRSWFRGEKTQANEVKVILVGNGAVGKTTLVKCLTGKKPNPKEPTTHRIIITNHSVAHNESEVKLNFWDFGGQDVMHSTHQFFMSKRSIYLLLLDGRKDEDAEYWLNLIKSFGGNSPVLVVMNKIDANPSYDVDRRFLMEKYPFINGFYRTICIPKKIVGVKELNKGLIDALNGVEILSTEWRKDWLVVKEQIEKMNDNFIAQAEYNTICEAAGITNENDKEILADFLNDLGVIVHFKDIRLDNLHILQPQWASRAAYKIINCKKVADSHGRLKMDWMKDIMKKEDESDFDYPKNIHPYVLDLMQKFELCYQVKENNEYLIPELMDKQQPELPVMNGAVLEFYFEYKDILPRSILPRFIVRMHEDIKDNLHWRTGVVLSPKEYDSTAIIIADLKEKRIYVTANGKHRKEHFFLIRKTFHSLHSIFEKLDFTEWMLLPDADHAVEYDELAGLEALGEEYIKIGKLRRSYRVKDLLDGIESASVRKEEYQWDTFISYSSKDAALISKITKDLKAKKISYWLDSERIAPGDDIIDKMTEGLQKCKHFIVCISRNQNQSNWSNEELKSRLVRVISGSSKQRILPLILDDTTSEEVPEFIASKRAERYNAAEQYERLLKFLETNR